MRWGVMCIFLFLRFYNFTEGILCIYIIFLKKLRPLLLYLTYKLVQLFIAFNRTDKSLFKQVIKYGKRLSWFIYIHCIKLKNVRVIIFPFICSRFSFVSNPTNLFILSLNRFVLKKSCLNVAGFLQPGALFVPCICIYTFYMLVNWIEKKTFLYRINSF